MEENQENDRVKPRNIVEEMEDSYLDYSMSVIVSRALPDVRDGLKPVHRRILFAMNEMGLEPNKGYKKSARITGETMGKFHPHGDSSIYDAMARMAQDFSMRYMLVDGHGNFGSVDGDRPAAQRYTEARLSKIATEMLSEIGKDTVDFVPNYDEELKEPTVLPSRYPNLLVNGSSGIAVGMATNIPPHNLREVVDGVIKIIDNRVEENRETDVEELLEIVKGPDFPTHANVLGLNGIRSAYRTGRGKIKVRAEVSIEPIDHGKEAIIVTELPYQVNKARLIEKIAELVKDKKIDGITYLRDESGRNGMRIVMELRKDVNANVVLNQLYKHSQLQETFGVIMLALVNGQPKVLNLFEMLNYYVEHQKEVVTRRTNFDLNKALRRAHIVEGLVKALDNIDEVISIIRGSKDTKSAKENLSVRFEFSEEQATAIVEMRFRSLTGMEREKLENELRELNELIKELRAILEDETILYRVIKEELLIVRTKYGDERRTKLLPDADEFDMEDLIEDELSVITMTHMDYIKRLPLTTYKSQNRGGRGIMGMQTREEDLVKNLFICTLHENLFFFTTKGKVYKIKAYELPEAGRTARGTAIVNLLNLDSDEKIKAVIPLKEFDEDESFVMITEKGVIKKTYISSYNNIRTNGIIALNIREDDSLVSVQRAGKDTDIFIATRNGLSITFALDDLRALGRSATGVKAISLKGDDKVITSLVIKEGYKILMVSENGYGKCTDILEYRTQNRGGKGSKTYRITDKTGPVVDASLVNDNEELMILNSTGVIIRIRVNEISTTSRVTQGVKLINLNGEEKVISITKISENQLESFEDEEIVIDEEVVIDAEILNEENQLGTDDLE